jgi:Fur family transcriptional regulator, ferric uptake regulator
LRAVAVAIARTQSGGAVARAHNVAPLEAPDLEAALTAVRSRGLRVTSPRRQLVAALYETEEPLTADALAGRMADADVASVYRNLETLEQVGLVKHFHLGHGPARYVRAGAGVREYLVCDRCGRVLALAPDELDDVRDAVRDRTGWEARFTHFPISGLCADCDAHT